MRNEAEIGVGALLRDNSSHNPGRLMRIHAFDRRGRAILRHPDPAVEQTGETCISPERLHADARPRRSGWSVVEPAPKAAAQRVEVGAGRTHPGMPREVVDAAIAQGVADLLDDRTSEAIRTAHIVGHQSSAAMALDDAEARRQQEQDPVILNTGNTWVVDDRDQAVGLLVEDAFAALERMHENTVDRLLSRPHDGTRIAELQPTSPLRRNGLVEPAGHGENRLAGMGKVARAMLVAMQKPEPSSPGMV